MAWLEKKFAAGQQKEYRESRIQNLLDKELLPHLGSDESVRTKKAIFLGRIVRQVLEMAITNRDPNDKDHYANKRVRLADLMEDYSELCSGPCKRSEVPTRDITTEKRTQNQLMPQAGCSDIKNYACTSYRKLGWRKIRVKSDRTTYLASLSHMRRVTSPSLGASHTEARDLHPTHWGRLCPNETPEGQNCGLVKICPNDRCF